MMVKFKLIQNNIKNWLKKSKTKLNQFFFFICLNNFSLKPIGSVEFIVCIFEIELKCNNYTNIYIIFMIYVLRIYHLSFMIFYNIMYVNLYNVFHFF